MQSKLLNFVDLVGKSEEYAEGMCENFGYILRVASRDGVVQIATCEVRLNRINVCVINSVVDAIYSMG